MHIAGERYLTRVALCALLAGNAAAQGTIAGVVLGADAKAIESAAVRAERSDKSVARDAVTDDRGAFRLRALAAGTYVVTVHRVGYRNAELLGVRVVDGQTRTLNVTLTQAATQLSTIEVVTSPTAIDATTPELSLRLDRKFTELLPSARDASSLIALVPGARKDQLWGGAPGVSNDYRLDGVSMNHPGLGGDFLALSVDWIETLEVKGLGAGAEYGNFQGGVINAITKSGSNERRSAIRLNYESPKLTATNINRDEQGAEQAGRRELGGEIGGPILRDRLFYFAAGQYVGRDVRSPNLTTTAAGDFQPVEEQHADARGMGKLTWLPRAGQRVEALGGFSTFSTEHAGVNGVDDATALQRVRQPTGFYGFSFTDASRSRSVLDVRVAGFRSTDNRLGYGGPATPAVQRLQLGRMPTAQNAAFDERRRAESASGSVQLRLMRHAVWTDHQFVIGADATRTWWRDARTRNGGLTWRPYTFGLTSFDPLNAASWGTVGSDWGGEMQIDSDTWSDAIFAQDNVTVGSRLTLTPGVRQSRWIGWLTPNCGGLCNREEAVRARATDPRLGAVLDVTGKGTLALKAHWGRYHQALYALFFDRTAAANVYSNQRFYYSAPPLTSSRATYSMAQRNTAGSGFSSFFDETILDESGQVVNYRQPYVEQLVLGIEKTIGPRWKAEATYTSRRNKDIVGLLDRNLATNYSPIHGVFVDHRLASGRVLDAHGNRLKLPTVWISNQDLKATLNSCGPSGNGPCVNPFTGVPTKIGGYTYFDVENFTWEPDLVLTPVPQARREYGQITATVRTSYDRWRGEASVTAARLKGNVPGVTGYGTTGTTFSAGPFAHPNEAINFDGVLPDAQQFEGKVWLSARLPYGANAGLLFTHTYREMFAPTFSFNGRYVYSDTLGAILPSRLFQRILGQSEFVEPRGSRFYPSRDILDLHLEWRSPRRAVIAVDLFNTLGSSAITLINTNIGDQTASDPTSKFAATRLRVTPRTLRIGMRVD